MLLVLMLTLVLLLLVLTLLLVQGAHMSETTTPELAPADASELLEGEVEEGGRRRSGVLVSDERSQLVLQVGAGRGWGSREGEGGSL
jgi:hypothetical protein